MDVIPAGNYSLKFPAQICLGKNCREFGKGLRGDYEK
jgi:hypothetical protein